MMRDQRRSTRVAAGWQGRYTLDSQPSERYRCRVVDVSLGGAALELFGPAPGDHAGIRVEFCSDSLPQGLRLPARARNMRPSAATSTGLRVGVEWHNLTRAQATMLTAIVQQTFSRAS